MADLAIATDETFEDKVLKADRPVLVDFTATWCGPCKAMAPALADVSREFTGEADVYAVDIEQSPATSAAHGVRAVPTFLVFHRGEVVDRIVGSATRSQLAAALEKAIDGGK